MAVSSATNGEMFSMLTSIDGSKLDKADSQRVSSLEFCGC